MITVKTEEEIEVLKESGKILKGVLDLMEETIRPGISTQQLNDIAEKYIRSHGAIPSCLHYEGYPRAICVSVNEEVVHGIPNRRKILREGDIVSVDLCVTYKGMVTDAARTFGVGEISAEDKRLIEVTKESFFKAIEILKEGTTVGDIGYAVQTYAEKNGFGVVRDLTGHAVGYSVHEDPMIPNYGKKGRGYRLKKNMVICIEPMITAGTYEVDFLDDGWTCVTMDGKNAAHYENTIVIREDGVEIITM